MATRRVTEADLLAEVEAHERAARASFPPATERGVVANRAKTCCPKCKGPYTQDGSRRKCVPCDRESNRITNARWRATPEGRARQRAAWNRHDAKRRAKP